MNKGQTAGIISLMTLLALYSACGERGTSGKSYLNALGYSAEYAEKASIKIPDSFDRVYSAYNALQREYGYDLAPYAGRECTRYTYTIKNYPDNTVGVRANLLICDNTVIGGDISTVGLYGFMTGLAPIWEQHPPRPSRSPRPP